MKIFRIIRSQWFWFATNVVGWGVATACTLAVVMFTSNEISYDRYHSNADQIYRATLESNNGSTSMHPARVVGEWPLELQKEYPALEKIARLVPFRKSVVKIKESKFYLSQAYSTDSSFFEVFDVDIISGSKSNLLTQPNRVLISRSIAQKYFGSIDVTGKPISILNQQLSEPLTYTIDGVYDDFPSNSHFHPDLLASYTEIDNQTTWAYTYYLITKGTDTKALCQSIKDEWEKEKEGDDPTPTLHLQKLTNIHLFSNKTREMESNGSFSTLIILVSAGLIILLIALINYINLYRVKLSRDSKQVFIKKINGAKKTDLAKDTLTESLILSGASIFLGLFLASRFSYTMNINILSKATAGTTILICLCTIALISTLALLPLFKSTKLRNTAKGKAYTVPLVFQFALSIIAIIGAFLLTRQINLLQNMHPQWHKSNMIVMANNPWDAVQRFEVFKEELLKNPQIEGVTGAMEAPGGDILDAIAFEMEGISPEDVGTINIFTIDTNFFTAMDIKPIAGTVDLGHTPSHEWESWALELSTLKMYNSPDKQKISELEEKVGNYREKYIINQSALNLLGITNANDAIGKHFRLNFHLPYLFPEGKIVGVVPNIHYTNLHNEERPLAIVARKTFTHCFIITLNPKHHHEALTAIEEVWTKLNPDYPFQYQYISDAYQAVYTNEFSQFRQLSIFAIISLILSSLGMLAMSSFTMQQKVKEIGIRKINGAKTWEIMLMLNMDFVKWVAIAFVIATPVAYFAMDRWLQNFAYRTALSWWIFVLAGILALAIALLTVSWQSWLAARRNPIDSLKYE